MKAKTNNMDFIERKAKDFIKFNFIPNVDKTRSKAVVEKARDEIFDIDDPMDKAKFLYLILEENHKIYEKHLPDCPDPKICPINAGYDDVRYLLTQELNRLGLKTDNPFTIEEQFECDQTIDEILDYLKDLKKDISDLKDGQQIIYDDLIKEIEELKTLYVVGKKNWWKIFYVELAKMTAGGIVSETISKGLLEASSNIGHEILQLGSNR